MLLLRPLAPLKWWIALAVLLGAGTIASSISLMAASAYLISAAALHPSIADLAVAIVGVRFFGIARGVLRYLERLVSHTVTLRLLGQWRVWFYRAIEPLAPARLLDYRSGDLLSRSVADIDSLQDFYIRVIAPPAVALVIATAMAIWLWVLNPALALVMLCAFAVAGVGLPSLAGLTSRAPARQLVAARGALNSLLVDSIQGLPELLVFNQAKAVSDRIQRVAQEFNRAQTRLSTINSLHGALGSLIAQLTMVAILGVAIGLADNRQLNGVYLAALALATAASFESLLPLPQAAQSLAAGQAAARRLSALIDTPPIVVDPYPDGAQAPSGTSLEIVDLRFGYSATRPPALDGISLSVPKGRRVAIVGPSGAGKTTLVNLLLRFYECQSGEVRLGGISLRDLPQKEVRRLIGVVSQGTYLFNTTIRENLLLARPSAPDEALFDAVRRAQIGAFIDSLPRGLETPIGERGLQLSGGERQRLGVARVLLRDTPVIVLDEPSANLDASTERALMSQLMALFEGRTLLLITHRLIGLDSMDEIVVLDRGRVVESGTETELLRREGLYFRMWTLQHGAHLE